MSNIFLTRLRLLQYSMLALPVAFAGFPLYVLAPDHYATHYGLSLSLLGLILLGLRLFDAVQDPLIGMLSDRFRSSLPWLMPLSAILLWVAVHALFNAMSASPAVWFALCMALAVSAYSVLSINLNALGALWTTDEHSQTRIAAFREAFGLVGLVIAVSAPGILEQTLGKEQTFFGFSIMLAMFLLVGMLAFHRWFSTHASVATAKRPDTHIRKALRNMPADTRRLLAVYAVSMMASSIPAVLVLFFVRDLLGAEHYTGLFLLLYFCSGALGMPLWKRLSQRLGKHRAWLFSILLAVASFIWAFFLNKGDIWQYGLICVFTGLALGADLTLPPSILADQLHRHRLEPHAATHYAFLALIAKASLALASGVVLPFLEMAGFIPAATNSTQALLGLSLAYAVLPCILKLCAGMMLAHASVYSTQGVSDENNHLNRTYGSSHHV